MNDSRTAIVGSILIIMVLYLSCASSGSLSGGPEDTTPPQVMVRSSTPNFQTNYFPEEILLEFDEYIQLDSRNPLFVSPPLTHRLKTQIKGKTLSIRFDEREVLRPQTTYTLQLGKHVVDLNERNPLLDYTYTFSTGDYLDSLILSGVVRYGDQNEALKDGTVLLYRSLEDSTFDQGQPDYLGYTDDMGYFEIRHLPVDEFHVIGLQDQNKDLKYDQGTDRIAFDGSRPIRMLRDTSLELFAIQEFLPLIGTRLTEVHKDVYRLEFNQVAENIDPIEDDRIVYRKIEKDSIVIWTRGRLDSLILSNGENMDTAFAKKSDADLPLRPLTSRIRQEISAPSGTPYKIQFSNPLTEIDTAQVSWLLDTVSWELQASIDTEDIRTLLVFTDMTKGIQTDLVLSEGLVTDMYGQKSPQDTVRLAARAPTEYAGLVINCLQMDSLSNYLLELSDEEGELLVSEEVTGVASYVISVPRIPVQSYQLQIVLDINQNGQWDRGSFARKRQEEPLRIEKVQSLRPEWDTEIEIIIGDL